MTMLAYTHQRTLHAQQCMVKPKSPTLARTQPTNQRARVSKPPTLLDAAVEAQLQMPNEWDESVAMAADAPDPVIKQAAVNVARGLQDTSKGAELERTFKKLK